MKKIKSEYEISLRRCLCIFSALETLLLTVLAVTDWTRYRNIKLFYHEIDLFNYILPALIVMSVFGGSVVLSLFSKVYFIFWEGLHFIAGVFTMFIGLNNFMALLLGAVLSFRFLIYILSMKTNHEQNKSE